MTIAADMQAIADDLMRMFGVPATYVAVGADPDDEPVVVTVRCKPKRRMTSEGRTFLVMEISVRSSEVAEPNFGDVFTIEGEAWKLSSLPLEFYEITSHAGGAMWQLTLVKDAISTGRGGA